MKKISDKAKIKWLQDITKGFETLIKQEDPGLNKMRMGRIKKMIEVVIEECEKEN